MASMTFFNGGQEETRRPTACQGNAEEFSGVPGTLPAFSLLILFAVCEVDTLQLAPSHRLCQKQAQKNKGSCPPSHSSRGPKSGFRNILSTPLGSFPAFFQSGPCFLGGMWR